MTDSIKILSVVGARPNFMKIAPIADAISAYNVSQQHRQSSERQIEHIIVHTGQHYDEKMSKLFFLDLQIPKPHINLEVGSASHAEQTAEIMKRFEPILKKERPDVVIVVGDVTSTISCALVASKIQYPLDSTSPSNSTNPNKLSCSRPLIAHVEAGLRSFDRSMPEEINRLLTDAIADILFTTEESANKNLRREGIPNDKIHFVGNVMIDTLLKHGEKAEQSEILYKLGLTNSQPDNMSTQANPINSMNPINPYALLTLHRPSNVDNKKTFQGILEALLVIGENIPIIFPIHPRTLNRIHEFGFEQYVEVLSTRNPQLATRNRGIYCVDPLGYLDFLHLLGNARLALTDSGGIQEETTILRVPCVTLRRNTERPVTVSNGTNVIAGTQKENIIKAGISHLNKRNRPNESMSPKLWDGKAAERIINVLINFLGQ